MEPTNIFNHKPDEEKTNLSAPLEGEFINPPADAEIIDKELPGDEAISAEHELVGTDGNVNDEDSSLTVDTDKPATTSTDLPLETDGHDKP
jgi:hypothetical protein